MATNWERSKAKKLLNLLGGSEPSTEEKAALAMMEMTFDVSASIATGSIMGWITLAKLYDEDKALSNQSVEFQRQAAVVVASNIGMSLVLYGSGLTRFEFMAGRHTALSPVMGILTSPIVAVPATGLYLGLNYPEVAGPQYQSAMTGQPGIGSAGNDLIYGNKTWKDYWKAIWR